MKPIPVTVAEAIAKEYGYDQIIIYARRPGDDPAPHGEHMTTYGSTKQHCLIAARMGAKLKHLMGWNVKEPELEGENV